MEKFTYMSAQNVGYIEELFQMFLQNPSAVDPEWKMFFEGVEFAKKLSDGTQGYSEKEMKVYDLIRAYRSFGHRKGTTDPLKLQKNEFGDLDLKNFGLEEKDKEQAFEVGSILGLKGAKLKTILERLEKLYCGNLTSEYMDCYPEMQLWMQKEIESASAEIPAIAKKRAFEMLVKTECMEKFIHSRFVGQKRFSLEGGDALLPMMEHLLHQGAQVGVEEIVVGMAHRGRLNMLVNFCGKAVGSIFAEFEGIYATNQNFVADGDVKYHMGYSADRESGDKKVHVSMAYNPSHLEVVNPVATGMAFAKQSFREDTKERTKVIPVLVHGDAAVIGQGVVTETLQLSRLNGYSVGGTIHIVVNNQVGFTTSPEYSRSSTYCTDVAKALRIPVMHVNGDDIDACLRTIDIALKFRQTFHQDIFIDVICYRRFGHNEGDEPAFTQPVMYDVIKSHPTPLTIYGTALQSSGVIAGGVLESATGDEMNRLQGILETIRKEPAGPKFFTLEGRWKGLRRSNPTDFWLKTETAISEEKLREVGNKLTTIPSGYHFHPKLVKLIENRKKMLETGEIDWGMGELLGYGSLIQEGTSVRLSGQDVGRGTFTHRQSVWTDIENQNRYIPLNQVNPGKAQYNVHDSHLSELAVLGFEYGITTADPKMLTVWEAQFGDFSNGAQILIDQFIVSAESKWQRMSGITLLLPHGYEGQGPEHSSARMERYLQMCAQENIQVCYPSTPAQIFHIMRRQMLREFRKPLIIMSPKSLLRHPKVVSSISDFTKGTFQETIFNTKSFDLAKVQKLLLCTGKIYYELEEERLKNNPNDPIAILRIEQLYPFPGDQIANIARQMPQLKQVAWVQEEPKNMGAYSFIAPRLQEKFSEIGARVAFQYIGRTERASPAIGSTKIHIQEQSDVVRGAFR